MRIAVVAPSPVPYSYGGAENLWWGLENYISSETAHVCELIKLPSPEGTFWDIADSYQRFSQLDLAHFDMVISGKYPAWMVRHPNHVCYMLHRLRGLYDTYHFSGKPLNYTTSYPLIRALQKFMGLNKGRREALDEFFGRLFELRKRDDIPSDALAFPGPFSREVVHFLDDIGLSRDAIRRYAAISANIAARDGYFPADAEVSVLYPATRMRSSAAGGSEYLLTVGRLDAPKRVGLLIDAMAYVKTNIELRVVGSGPLEGALHKKAAPDKRIVFTGFVGADELGRLYANALAVVYVPFDEDYGYITVEAYLTGKPVVTVLDSGGVKELVEDGKTGFCVEPDPRALAVKLDWLAEHRGEAAEMGRAGRQKARQISWRGVVDTLLYAANPRIHTAARIRKRLVVASTYPVYPPRGGGQMRIYHLYRKLTRAFDVELVTLAPHSEHAQRREIAPGLWEHRIPKSRKHQDAETEMSHTVDWVPVTDIAMIRLFGLSPVYLETLEKAAKTADVLATAQPYTFPALRAVSDKALWYDSQNIEWSLKRDMLPDNTAGRELVELTREIETQCCQYSEWVLACSPDDAEAIRGDFGVSAEKILLVPNGTDLDSISYVPPVMREKERQRLGVDGCTIAVFIGSCHGPNIDAVNFIIDIAPELPDVIFLILGNVELKFRDQSIPKNIRFLGAVDDHTMDTVMSVADVALNPMGSGSGTNIKMLDYFAFGVPVVSTQTGVRGIAAEPERHLLVGEPEDFPGLIKQIAREDSTQRSARVIAARQLVEERYDWSVIAERTASVLSN